jgi:hypothetical protein
MSHRRAASLTGSLLVRKGAASPSYVERHGRYEPPHDPYTALPALIEGAGAPALVSAGTGADLPKAANGPAGPRQDNGAIGAIGGPDLAVIEGQTPVSNLPVRPVGGPSAGLRRAQTKRRFTLRLTPEQHLRLRLAAVHLGVSAQKFVLDAVEAHLLRAAGELGGTGCGCLRDGGGGQPVPQDPGPGR